MKNKCIYIVCVIFALLSVSCDDFLDVDPTQKAQLETPGDVSKLLVNAYPGASYILFMEVMSDNVGDNSRFIEPSLMPLVDRQTTQNFYWENVDDVEQDTPTLYWTACYEAIATANLAIQFIEESGDPDKFSAQMGEALVCRAYAHFMLAILFSKPYNEGTADSDLGIPYVTKPETVVFADYRRESLAKTYELIENDLLKGLPLINDGSYEVYKYHFNKMAANAFACRFFLFKQDWEKVVYYASESIGTTSEASLLRDWNGTAGYATLGPRDLQAMYTNYQELANLLLHEEITWCPYFSYFRYQMRKNISEEIYGNGTKNVTSGNFSPASALISYTGGIDESFILKFKDWWKYTSINAESGHVYLMHPLFTSEEVLLNRAEAYAMMGNTNGVLHDLNIYYSKRIRSYNASTHNITPEKINSYAATLPNNLSPIGYTINNDTIMNQVKVIVDTRRKEFIHEGNRWFDVKRFNIEITHTSYDGSRTETLVKNDLRRELQIPQDAIAFGITPNPR